MPAVRILHLTEGMWFNVQTKRISFFILSKNKFDRRPYSRRNGMDNERIVSMLNGLIEISRDGAEGFRTCADDADDAELKLYFRNRAQSCEEAVNKLSTEVRRYGGDPDTSGTVTGTLHRAWVDLKTAMTNRDNLAVLEECERGEAAAVVAYENALREEMPGDLRALLDQQYEGAKRNHDRVRLLRDTARHGVT
jgi:uncharacterized protein (TIGR02284 family)